MLIIADTETTGVAPGSAIVELASVIITTDGDEYHYRELMAPGCPIPEGASNVHGIYNRDVDHLPPAEERVQEWWQDVTELHNATDPSAPIVYCGHNAAFDLRMLSRYISLPPVRVLCTMRLARALFPVAPNHKLTTLFEFFGLKGQYNAHSALDDCLMTRDLLGFFRQHTGKSYYDLASEQDKPMPLTRMPFGKHRGLEFTEVPASYMRYMLGLPDLDKDVAQAMTTELARRAA